ncbi:MAG: hypothetical protein H7Y13_00925 [Sphingobacteriaceae bacterium]|nr:hypothetical protein [Sphingobacteriaceae bacterium]
MSARILVIVYFIIAPFMVFSSLYAQSNDSTLRKHQFKSGLKMAGASASYEMKLLNKFSLYTEASYRHARTKYERDTYDSSYEYGTVGYSDLEKISTFWMQQYGLELRQYYGLKKRARNEDNITAHNSFDFFSAGTRYGTGTERLKGDKVKPGDMTSYHISWGSQRALNKDISIELQLGAAYKQWSAIPKKGVLPFVEMRFGYVINK